MKVMARIQCPALCLLATTLAAAPLSRPYAVDSYDVRIQVDIPGQRLDGQAAIHLHSLAEFAISALEFDAGGTEIESVTDGGRPQYLERKGGLLIVALTSPLQPDERRALTIRYHAAPSAGLKFSDGQIYTAAVSDWLPSNDRPGERSALHLTLFAPADMKAAASGQLVTASAGSSEWRLDSPAAPMWFGFALGRFEENASEADGVKLRALGASQAVLAPAADALRYLSAKTGTKYPGTSYTLVFLHGAPARALAGGVALLPEGDAQGLPKQPDALRDLAATMAHQWYGVGIGTQESQDVWLNQALPAFLGDSFVGERLGKSAYNAQVAQAESVYERLRAEGKDQPLADIEWNAYSTGKDSLAETKGVAFLNLLEQTLDDRFENGLRLFTSEAWGKGASSEGFQAALAAARSTAGQGGKKSAAAQRSRNPKLLGNANKPENLFDTWVYGVSTGKTKN